MTDHDYHKGCATGDCGGACPRCSLDVCKVCNLYEGALTSECPGSPVYSSHADRIYRGEIDFRGGRWVELASPHAPGSTR